MIKKPWGSEVILFESGQARVKLLRVKMGKRLSKQYHESKQESMALIQGSAWIEIGDERCDMKPGQIYTIGTGVIHRLAGFSVPEAVVLEMSHGPQDDIVRIADDYGRAC